MNVRMFVSAAAAILMAVPHVYGRNVYFSAETRDMAEFRAAAELAKTLGATHMLANSVEPSMWQWDAVGRKDPYPNWTLHRPSLFKFHVPKALRRYLPAEYADRNMAVLKERAAILGKLGLKAMYDGIDPGYLPEGAYRDHPEWRGPRCDQCRRASNCYYAPCVDNPEVRALFVEAAAEMCKVCPFEFFDVMCNDSGSGLCWVEHLYPGSNGPERCRSRSVADRYVSWLSVYQEGAEKAGLKADVNFNRYSAPREVAAVMPYLKPGQSFFGRTKDGATRTATIGYPNRFIATTFPVGTMPAMTIVARQLQAAQADGDRDLRVALRGMDEVDTIAFLREWIDKPIGQTPSAMYAALESTAAKFVGSERCGDLVRLWDSIDRTVARLERLSTGGHVFLLGTVHQRWLTRPLTAFPGELKGEDRSYWRDYLFQAQGEREALDYVDMQGHKWLSGYGGMYIVDRITDIVLSEVADEIAAAKRLVSAAADADAARYLKGLCLKLRMYRAVVLNMRHVVDYADTLEITKGYQGNPPRDRTVAICYHGDAPLHNLEGFERAEIENTVDIIAILEEAAREGVAAILTASEDKFTNVMNLPPVPRLIRELKRKISIMEEHRRDLLRLYTSRNW